MTSRDFVYWLQGYFEILGKSEPLTAEQTECIKRHLNMVFYHEIDPKMGDKEHQQKLTGLHECKKGHSWKDDSGNTWHVCPDHPGATNTSFCPSSTLIRC